MFDPCFSTKEKGNGLGLSVCCSIMKRHEGGIRIESNEYSASSACGFRFARGWLGADLMLVIRPPKLLATAASITSLD